MPWLRPHTSQPHVPPAEDLWQVGVHDRLDRRTSSRFRDAFDELSLSAIFVRSSGGAVGYDFLDDGGCADFLD